MKKITKLFSTVAKSINDDDKIIRFKISDSQEDRSGEVVDQGTWNFKHYMENPIVLWGHNPSEPENVLGKTISLETHGDSTYAEMQFDTDVNSKAALVWKQLLKGTLRAVSVGFIAHLQEGNVLKDNELLEISVVPIPANPRAIALSYKDGSLSKKDARYLKDSMAKEIEYLDEQLAASESKGQLTEKNMEEVEAKLTQVTELIGSLGEQVANLTTVVADLQKPTEEVAQTPTDDEVKEGTEEEDPAKGGEDDQPGAGEETDIDLDAELTPELEEALAAELAGAA